VSIGVDDPARAEQVLTPLPGVRTVRTESSGVNVEFDGIRRSDLVAALVHGGVAVDSVESSHRLEDAFLGLLAHEART
jgi:ABC-2 type transport system ATP-binding protein